MMPTLLRPRSRCDSVCGVCVRCTPFVTSAHMSPLTHTMDGLHVRRGRILLRSADPLEYPEIDFRFLTVRTPLRGVGVVSCLWCGHLTHEGVWVDASVTARARHTGPDQVVASVPPDRQVRCCVWPCITNATRCR